MTSIIEESINANIHVFLEHNGKTVFDGESAFCGMEISDNIEELLKKLDFNNKSIE